MQQVPRCLSKHLVFTAGSIACRNADLLMLKGTVPPTLNIGLCALCFCVDVFAVLRSSPHAFCGAWKLVASTTLFGLRVKSQKTPAHKHFSAIP
eukprot:1138969-Pelagomonas_calceolata.AAC.5